MDKVILLLEALEEQKKSITYYALDLSYSELASNFQAIPVDRFHYVRFAALHGTFDDGLHCFRTHQTSETVLVASFYLV